MNEGKKIIFLNSYLPRTGHNFTSEALKVFSNHQVLPHNQSETKLSFLLDSYLNHYKSRINPTNYKAFFDALFIQNLRERILCQAESDMVMIKDTSFVGVENLVTIFPEDIHILLIRDPKMVFSSWIKSLNLSKTDLKNRLKKIGIATGLYPYYYSKRLSRQVMDTLPDFNKFYVLRYEDLFMQNKKTLLELKTLIGTEKSLAQIKAEIDEIPVINSSFYEEVGGKKIWDQKSKTTRFDPVNRKGGSFLVNKGIELGSKKFRKKLNYI